MTPYTLQNFYIDSLYFATFFLRTVSLKTHNKSVSNRNYDPHFTEHEAEVLVAGDHRLIPITLHLVNAHGKAEQTDPYANASRSALGRLGN